MRRSGVTYSEVIAEQHSRVQASNYIQLSVRERSNGERANGCMLMSDDVDGTLSFSPVPETNASICRPRSKRVRRDWSRDNVMDRSRALLDLEVYGEILQLAIKVQSEEGYTKECSSCAKIPHQNIPICTTNEGFISELVWPPCNSGRNMRSTEFTLPEVLCCVKRCSTGSDIRRGPVVRGIELPLTVVPPWLGVCRRDYLEGYQNVSVSPWRSKRCFD